MISISAQIRLNCSLEDALRALADPASFLCFPGFSRIALDGEAPCFEQEFDLTLIGPRKQPVVLRVEEVNQTEGTAGLSFSSRGELLSLSGSWKLEAVNHLVHAHLILGYTVSDELERQAVDELRRHNPLPIRTDADAILARAVEDFFTSQLSKAVEKFQENLCKLLEGRLRP